MIISKLILENIKSYKYQEIDFDSGINCVLGLNGSGKTTIIESIGLALFNYKKASNFSSMLRYNETKGLIELTFTANDNRNYKIVRQIRKTSSTAKIIDIENKTELYNTIDDVYGFVQKILNINKSREFSKLFEQVVAVPQGQYVNAFLETPAKRKENFDRLFGLHIYKNIADKIKVINDNIKNDKISKVNEEIKFIEGNTINYSRDKKNLDELNKELEALSLRISKLNEEKLNYYNKKIELEKLKEQIELINQDLKIKQTNLDNYLKEKSRLNTQLEQAQKAEQIVASSLPGYLKYQENLELIRNLEISIKNSESIHKKLNEINTNIEVSNKDIENKNVDLDKKKKLLDKKQESLDDLSKNYYIAKSVYEEDYQNYEVNNKKLTNDIIKVDEIIKETSELLYNFNLTSDKIKETNYINDDLFNELKEEINQVDKLQSEFISVTSQIDDLNSKLNVLKSKKETNFNNAKLTEGGVCPFLNEKCKNINGENLSSYFTNLMNDNEIEITAVLNQIDELKEKLGEKKFVDEKRNELENKLNHLMNDKTRREKYILEFMNTYGEHIDTNISFSEALNKLIDDKNTVLAELNKNKESLLVLKEELINKRTTLSTKLFGLKKDEEELTKSEKEIKEIKQDILDISFLISQMTKKLGDYKKQSEDLNLKVIDYDKNKNELSRLNEENLTLQKVRDNYNINIEKSKELEKTQILISKNNEMILSLELNINNNNEKLVDLNTKYKAKAYEEVIIKYETTISNLNKETTRFDEKTQICNALTKDVLNMEKMLDKKKCLLVELNNLTNTVAFLVYMRDLYSRLPQELSIRYREYVSYMATNSYRKISKEAVHISISDDYELSLIDDVNNKNVKTIDQLSGGEQMSIALSVRFAMMRQLSGLDVYFLDEPTINLDYQRRNNISDVVSDISKDLTQLFVISHDDTFDDITERIIKVTKLDNISKVE